jgi:hypothetical protein
MAAFGSKPSPLFAIVEVLILFFTLVQPILIAVLVYLVYRLLKVVNAMSPRGSDTEPGK